MKKRVRSILLVLGLLVFALAGCAEAPEASSPPTASSPPAAESTPVQTESTPEPTDSPSENASSTPVYQTLLDNALQEDNFDDSITYDNLVHSPDEFAGTSVQLTGKIVQVLEGDGFTAYRFAIDNDYDKIIYVEAYPEYPTDSLAEDDYATLSGVAYGMYSYEAVLGNTITLPAVLAAKFEMAKVALPEYPAGPLTLEKRLSSGRLYSTTEIESFSIVDAEISYNGDLHITCEITGKVTGSGYLSLKLKCYDKDDILIKNANISASVSDGEKFRITDGTYIPMDTSRIEFAVD